MSAATPILQALLEATSFAPQGQRAGNLSVGRGALDGTALRIALVENRSASGAIGVGEAERLVALFKVCARERAPLVLFLDSAGARVSEGLRALGAFRALFRAGIEAAFAGVPLAVVLGANCFGGSSILAHLAPRRLHAPNTRLAMSGPAVLASAAGVSALDEMFRAMADAALSAPARAKASAANAVWSPGMDMAAWLREAIAAGGEGAPAFRRRHEALGARLDRRIPDPAWEPVTRRDLDRLYDGYQARESGGLLQGVGRRGGRDVAFLGLVGKTPLGITRAWRFADAAWQLAEAPADIEVLLDCATHAPRLDDEKVVLTEFILDMSCALAHAGARGRRVALTVLGHAGGAVYAALAAPARRVGAVHGADIQVLPGAAVFAILGEASDATPRFDDYRAAGVAEDEIKLGLLPDHP